MKISGTLQCSTCKQTQQISTFRCIDETSTLDTVLKVGEHLILEWKCNNCCFLNFVNVKNIDEDEVVY